MPKPVWGVAGIAGVLALRLGNGVKSMCYLCYNYLSRSKVDQEIFGSVVHSRLLLVYLLRTNESCPIIGFIVVLAVAVVAIASLGRVRTHHASIVTLLACN